MASNQESYASRSWALLTKDEGWIKPVLVLAAARLIPIVGPFGANGYALEWARLTSWGVDSAPKQKGVDVAGCIKSGARAFVVALGYGLVFGFMRAVLTPIFGGLLGVLLTLAISAAAMVIGNIAKLRATIYQKISAGYQLDRIFDMIKRDYKGLAHIAGFGILLMMGVGFVASAIMGLAVLTHLGSIVPRFVAMGDIEYADEVTIAITTLGAIGEIMPVLFVMSYFVHVASTIADLLINTAIGLWMRQFDVRNWGESADPLPGDARPHAAAQGAPVTQKPAQDSVDEYVTAPTPKPAAPAEAPAQSDNNEQSKAMAWDESNDGYAAATPTAHEAVDADRKAKSTSAEANKVEEPGVESFALDDTPVVADEPKVESFTFDDAPATEEDEPEARPFTLDDPTPQVVVDEPEAEPFTLDDAEAAIAEEPEVGSFTLDDSAQEEAAEEAAEFFAAEGRFTLDDSDPAVDAIDDDRDTDDVLDEIRSAIADADLEWPDIPYEHAYHDDSAPKKKSASKLKADTVETFDLDDVASEDKPVPPADAEDSEDK